MSFSERFQDGLGDVLHESVSGVHRMNEEHQLVDGRYLTIPTAGIGYRGAEFRTEGGPGVADTLRRCLKNSSDIYINYYPVLSTVQNLAAVETTTTRTESLTFIINGNGAQIADGVAGDLYLPYAFTIQYAVALADQSGSITVDVWNESVLSFPPENANSITASDPIAIVSSESVRNVSLTGWTKSLSALSVLRFNVDSCTTITRCTIALVGTRTVV